MKTDEGTFLSLFILLQFLFMAEIPTLFAQTADSEIGSAIARVDSGKIEEVRRTLPDLVARYQNNPGILYLQGRLATDGVEAVKFYQGVVDNFPKSEWADQALYRIYQYYYSLGLYRTADLKLQQLKRDYPNSPSLTGKREAILPKAEEEQVRIPEKEINPPEPEETVKTPPPPVLQRYTVQVGAFSTLPKAERQKTYFEDLGYIVEITNKIRSGKSLFLVWVGSYKSLEDARAAVKEIKAKYKIESMIVEK